MNTLHYPFMWLVVATLTIGIMAVSSGLVLSQRKLLADPGLSAELSRQLRALDGLRKVLLGLTILLIGCGILTWWVDRQAVQKEITDKRNALMPKYDKAAIWKAPDEYLAETDPEAALIAYGRDLVAHTNDYFGANGLVRARSVNHLNCQSCHLDAGTKAFGNNYSAVGSTYPQMRGRSGKLETIPMRVNDCFKRSLNGQEIDTTSREMKAIVAYIKWLGTGVPAKEKPKGSGLVEVPYLDRAADPAVGAVVFAQKCASCHGADGQGLPRPGTDGNYPPLWGPDSYNEAAGLFRLSRFAGYVKANMPFGASYDNPQLSDEEAWDLAAFVNSQPRPKHPFLLTDWPDIKKKPVDHPFGPFADEFPESQHKYGPYKPIAAFYKPK